MRAGYNHAVANIYFDLTRQFNADGPVAALASGQAVVYYRIAIMGKDGDWVILETPAACQRVLDVLRLHEACVPWRNGGCRWCR